MRRLTLFAKGNLDVRNSLMVSTVGNVIEWNGINEIVRKAHPGHLIRVVHEIAVRADVLLTSDGQVPAELRQRELPLGHFPLASQYSRRTFDRAWDVVVLTVQPEIMVSIFRHRRDGYFFYPHDLARWPQADREWVVDRFECVGYVDVQASMDNLARSCREIQAGSGAPILIYNLSAVVPGEQLHCHLGLDEALSTRIRRFNLGLVDLSAQLGISIVDVDALLARAGADRLKLGPAHLTADGYRLVATEVVRILQDLGCFD